MNTIKKEESLTYRRVGVLCVLILLTLATGLAPATGVDDAWRGRTDTPPAKDQSQRWQNALLSGIPARQETGFNPFINRFAEPWIVSLAYDAGTQRLYAGALNGLYILSTTDETYERKTIIDGLAANEVRDLALDAAAGTLYLCTERGLSIYHIDYDGDGLANVEEVSVYGTNPGVPDADVDTDGDGLLNVEEVDKYGTNPDVPDTDEDDRNDGDEIRQGTNPLVPDVAEISVLPDTLQLLAVSAVVATPVVMILRRRR